MDDKRVNVLVSDVSGHGVPAALIASMVKVAYSAQSERATAPNSVLREINRTLCGKIRGQFGTAACAYFDLDADSVRYSTAGHPPMLRWQRSRGRVEEVRLQGVLMGFLESANYLETEVPLETGDRVLLYTDGIVEVANAKGEFFGKERLIPFLERDAHLSAGELADELLEHVSTGPAVTRSSTAISRSS